MVGEVGGAASGERAPGPALSPSRRHLADSRAMSTVVLIPGLACDHALWQAQQPALVVAGAAKDLKQGADVARKSLSSGGARARLDRLIAVSKT